jgi:hypothetical protein
MLNVLTTNIEEVEQYKQWEKMPSLVGSNEAYHLATNWLSRVSVDVSKLNGKYPVHVGQPSWNDQGVITPLPLHYVTWGEGDYQAAKVGIFGPTKKMMGLTIKDESLSTRIFLLVTNQKELIEMTNIPSRLIETNSNR